MAKTPVGTVVAEGQKVINVVPGFGTSSAIPGMDWPSRWRMTLQVVMNYTEFFYRAIKDAYGPKEALAIYMDAHLMQGRLSGDAYKKAAQAQKRPLNCRTFIDYCYMSSHAMGETFFCYQRADGVYIYNTINQPHERLFLQMVEGATEELAVARASAWCLPLFAQYNPEINFAWVNHAGEHGILTIAFWDPDVTPKEPLPPEGGDHWVEFKAQETIRGKKWGPYYLRKPYARADTVLPPPADTSLYNTKNGLSPCGL